MGYTDDQAYAANFIAVYGRGTEKSPVMVQKEPHQIPTTLYKNLDHAHTVEGKCFKNRFGIHCKEA